MVPNKTLTCTVIYSHSQTTHTLSILWGNEIEVLKNGWGKKTLSHRGGSFTDTVLQCNVPTEILFLGLITSKYREGVGFSHKRRGGEGGGGWKWNPPSQRKRINPLDSDGGSFTSV